jgi:hypothetical protein
MEKLVTAEAPAMEQPKKEKEVLPEFVRCDIYLATSPSNRPYVGQARTHYRNGTAWLVAGYKVRWHGHVSEAKCKREKECRKLNDCIRAHGGDNFKLELLETCSVEEANEREAHYIALHDSIKNGLNVRSGGHGGVSDPESRQNLSNSVMQLSDEKRAAQFSIEQGWESAKIGYSQRRGKIIHLYLEKTDCAAKKLDFGGVAQEWLHTMKRVLRFASKVLPPGALIVCEDGIRTVFDLAKKEIAEEPPVEPVPFVRKNQEKPVDQGRVKKPSKDDKKRERLSALDIYNIEIRQTMYKGYLVCLMVVTHTDGKTTVKFAKNGAPIEELRAKANAMALQITTANKITNKTY